MRSLNCRGSGIIEPAKPTPERIRLVRQMYETLPCEILGFAEPAKKLTVAVSGKSVALNLQDAKDKELTIGLKPLSTVGRSVATFWGLITMKTRLRPGTMAIATACLLAVAMSSFTSNAQEATTRQKPDGTLAPFVFPNAKPRKERGPDDSTRARMGKYITDASPETVVKWYLAKWVGEGVEKMDGFYRDAGNRSETILVVHDYRTEDAKDSAFFWLATARLTNMTSNHILSIAITRATDDSATQIAVTLIDQSKTE
jgi:hypothetical protein